jgi:hypothetical protein
VAHTAGGAGNPGARVGDRRGCGSDVGPAGSSLSVDLGDEAEGSGRTNRRDAEERNRQTEPDYEDSRAETVGRPRRDDGRATTESHDETRFHLSSREDATSCEPSLRVRIGSASFPTQPLFRPRQPIMSVRNDGRPRETRSHSVSTPRSDYEPVGVTVGIGVANGSESGAPASTACWVCRLGSEAAVRRLTRAYPTDSGTLQGMEVYPARARGRA